MSVKDEELSLGEAVLATLKETRAVRALLEGSQGERKAEPDKDLMRKLLRSQLALESEVCDLESRLRAVEDKLGLGPGAEWRDLKRKIEDRAAAPPEGAP